MTPILSIIIPCYNSQRTLEETLKSVRDQKFENWEAIIVNDGSTDNTENIALGWVTKDKRFRYYSKPNEGLGRTRNFGIERAIGEYILPLDSDNLIEKDAAEIAIKILDKRKNVGVVYGHAELFGEKDGIWKMAKFDLEQLFVQNYIDACAFYRKSLWKEVKGYDEKMPYQGTEDWELWLAFGIRGVKFFRLNRIVFKYRISENSMIQSYTDEIKRANDIYIVQKYAEYYYLFFKENRLRLKKCLKESNEGFYKKYFQSLRRRVYKIYKKRTS